ncbi:MAG: TIGR00299 family protein [Rhodopirellula sp.]|nr:TIGR00299 family protein [Rhodopirellula sp.]
MGQIAYFDCISGISGDMTLGALVDLGADIACIESAVRSMGLPELTIRSETVKKHGFRAISVLIEHPPEHAHRHLHHITEMIDKASEVSKAAKEIAHRIFLKVAEAEAKVHGSTLEKVHFHEVGAIDSIADIVGTAVAMDSLGIQRISASAVPTGTGEIKIAHGRVSIPAPATAELLQGIPLVSSDIRAELTTPTGAAILKACATNFGPLPSMTIKSVGYGAGSMDLDVQANVLRVILGESTEDQGDLTSQTEPDRVVMLETNIDDSTPEQLADCATRLLSAGALDVFQTPCTMKKGRAGVILTAMTTLTRASLLENIIFEHSTAIGIRRYQADRHKLPREAIIIDTEYGPVRGKVVQLPSGDRRFTIEDDDARTLATSNQTNATEIRRAATAAYTKTT